MSIEIVVGFVSTTATIVISIAVLSFWLGKKFQNIDDRFKYVDEKFKEIDKRFNEVDRRFNELKSYVDERFNSLKSYVDERFKEIDGRFNSLKSYVDEKFDGLRGYVDERFNSLKSYVDDRFNEFEEYVDGRFGVMEKRFDERFNRLTHSLQSFNEFLISYLTSEGIIPVRSRDLLISEARNILKLAMVNPFSKEELEKLRNYVEKDLDTFTVEEAYEFLELARKFALEYGNRVEPWKLHLYAAFVYGYTLRRVYGEKRAGEKQEK